MPTLNSTSDVIRLGYALGHVLGFLLFVLGIFLGIFVSHWLFLLCAVPLVIGLLFTDLDSPSRRRRRW